jgi:hypothetical protein
MEAVMFLGMCVLHVRVVVAHWLVVSSPLSVLPFD